MIMYRLHNQLSNRDQVYHMDLTEGRQGWNGCVFNSDI